MTQRIPNKPVIINNSGKVLTNQELAIWSKKLAELKTGNYAKMLSDGTKVIKVNKKIIFSKGTFENPVINRIVVFDDELEMSLFWSFL